MSIPVIFKVLTQERLPIFNPHPTPIAQYIYMYIIYLILYYLSQ